VSPWAVLLNRLLLSEVFGRFVMHDPVESVRLLGTGKE
jgi:hypothetical protein